MTRTFLVAVTYDDADFNPIEDAAEIEEALDAAGILVESVKPWAAPAAPAGLIAPLPPNEGLL